MGIGALLLAYLIGAVPFGSWVARRRGVDLRRVGSGNSGATNVQRALGWGPGLLVALFDIVKGALAVLVAGRLGLNPALAGLCGVVAVLGHDFNAFAGFRGGKGVATSFGVVLLLDPSVAAATFLVTIVVVLLTRHVSLGSLVGGTTAAVVAFTLRRPAWELEVVTVLTLLIFYQHRDNIRRLQEGSESRLGQKAGAVPDRKNMMN